MPGAALVRRGEPYRLNRRDRNAVGMLISCKDASRLISQMQDGELSFRQRLAVRLHLMFCDACRRFVRQLRFLRTAMRRYTA